MLHHTESMVGSIVWVLLEIYFSFQIVSEMTYSMSRGTLNPTTYPLT